MGGIFLLQDSGGLVKMTEQQYPVEATLQELLANYPDLLAGEQIDEAQPRRWLLIGREAAVPSDDTGTARWALDHLFLDQDAVPTFVEVKRSSDTRIRREVVGQMLDYAANAVVYWPAEVMRTQFEAACTTRGQRPEDVLADSLGSTIEPDTYWESAKRNLQAGKVRLLFVADEIPAELRRVVEFLNGQMDPAEVLALEVKQYVGQSRTALVPRVVGQTAAAQDAKSKGRRTARTWVEASFLQALEERRGAAEVRLVKNVLEWAGERGLGVKWGTGAKEGSFYPVFDVDGYALTFASFWTGGAVTIGFGDLHTRPPFHDEAKRRELLRRLNGILDAAIPDDAISRWLSFPLAALASGRAMRQFLETLEWVLSEYGSAATP